MGTAPTVGVYDEEHTDAIVFPLGGIGTGSIGLAGNGRLMEFEIANRPNQDSYNGFSFFAIKAEQGGRVRTAKVIHGDLGPPYMGRGPEHFRGVGFGPPREALSGLPHFAHWRFVGQFPMAQLAFADQDGWVDVALSAFNPFIPHNSEDSSLPAALFSFALTNVSPDPLDITVAASLQNPFGGAGVNQVLEAGARRHLVLTPARRDRADPGWGELVLAAEAPNLSAQTYWYRGDWFDNLETFWREFTRPGALPPRHYSGPRSVDSIYDQGDVGTLARHLTLGPRETATVRFAITWYFPWFVNYWNPGGATQPRWRNYYATRFDSAVAVADRVLADWDRLERLTRQFRDALYQSTLPPAVLDRVAANLSVLKSATVARLTDGTLYGFEGCHADAGCCEGSCTHVWNYDQATPFLFPDLARSMRVAAFTAGLADSGRMAYRLLLPLERTRRESTERAAVDGQMGEIIKVYREWKISGDTAWLRGLWPYIQRALHYAWDPHNDDGWDRDRDGVLEGTQHHTLDVEFYGPNAYLTGFYIAALQAAAEMAVALGDDGSEYRRLAQQGRAWVTRHLFNGQYFIQRVDLTNPAYPVDPELGEVKYQLGDGCHIDQVIGQWHARVVGLGDILDPTQVRSALGAIYRYNFKNMRQHANVHRVFAVNGERGVVIATWPHGDAPRVPVPYHGECMTGYEYQVASHMIYEGLVDEGLAVVAAIAARYDGLCRNPWNEIECGSHYARAMASYSLLLALSGFEFDGVRQHMGFHPRLYPGAFRTFWSVGTAWGLFHWMEEEITLEVLGGRLDLGSLACTAFQAAVIQEVRRAGRAVEWSADGRSDVIQFDRGLRLEAGEALTITVPGPVGS